MSGFPGTRDLLDLAVETAPHGVLVCDERGTIRYVNRRIQELFGFPADELLGQPLDLLLDEPPFAIDTAGAPRELVGRRKNGTQVPIEVGMAVAAGSDDGLVVASVVDITERRMLQQSMLQKTEALAEVERLRDQLLSENVLLRDEVKALRVAPRIAAGSPAMQHALELVASVAPTDASVLLHGETGCGKELFAQEIHRLSGRRDQEMVRVNCAAIPTALIESELFGRERGAYTGALSRQAGRFEVADGTTIFLDEIGELSLDAQAKLLRVLQEKTIERLGSTKSIPVDVRVIAATNRDLTKEIAERTFREDLFYRLNVFPITVPPLRERVEDIPDLVWTFIDEFAGAFNKRIESISRESLIALQRYSWPGNVRELRNLIERAVILANGPRLAVEPPVSVRAEPDERTSLHEIEATHIRTVLERVGWRVRGTGGAAELLAMNPTTLDSRMTKLGIRRPLRRSVASGNA
jgi:PAS domain S-box-containing protein